MELPERPSPAVTAASVAAAYGAFAAVFRGPRARFWQRMTRTGLGLGTLALASQAELRRARPRPRDVATGVAIAAALYGVFQVGDRAARRILPSGAERERLWAEMARIWPDYDKYQTKTDREIPVVVLDPAN